MSTHGDPNLVLLQIGEAAQEAVARCIVTRTVPRGARVRLAGDSLRSVTSGFDPEWIGPAEDESLGSWPILAGRLPRPLPASGIDQGPRQVLLATCPGVEAGREVAVRGTFYPEGSGKGPTLSPYAGVSMRFRLEASGSSPDAGAAIGRQGETEAGEAWTPVSDWFGFVLGAGPPAQLDAFVDAFGNAGVRTFDRYLNPVPSDAATMEVALPDGRTIGAAFPDPTSGEYGAVRVPLPAVLSPGTRVTVRDGRGRQATGSPAAGRLPGNDRLFFGEFHWHTEASGDGTRPVADSYRSARDGLLLDFAGASDHFPFDRGLSLRDCADIADGFDAPGRFATLLGVELSWRMGHYNFHWADRDELDLFLEAWEARRLGPLAGTALAPDIAAFYGLPPGYFERAHPGRTLVIPHHTNATSEQFRTRNGLPVWTQFGWPLGHNDRRFLRLGEIVQTRGCFEAEEPDADWRIRFGAGGGSLRTALARGFRVGFTGGTDNHCGWPSRQSGGWVGLTGVYAPELSRAGIMRGLYDRRCYATTGVRIVADLRLNDAPMGSELQLPPDGVRRLAVRVHGTAPLERAEIVSQGAVTARLPVDGPDLVDEWVDDRRGRPVHDCYYYLRARQIDGHCVWTSPIWVDLALPPEGPAAYGGPVAWS